TAMDLRCMNRPSPPLFGPATTPRRSRTSPRAGDHRRIDRAPCFFVAAARLGASGELDLHHHPLMPVDQRPDAVLAKAVLCRHQPNDLEGAERLEAGFAAEKLHGLAELVLVKRSHE